MDLDRQKDSHIQWEAGQIESKKQTIWEHPRHHPMFERKLSRRR